MPSSNIKNSTEISPVHYSIFLRNLLHPYRSKYYLHADKKKSHCKKFKQYRKAQRRKQKITLKCHTPKQPSLTLSEHHFRHLPMHEKMLLFSSLARRCTSEQFSSVPWVVISFKLGFKPVFAYYVPVYFFASVCLHNSPLFFHLAHTYTESRVQSIILSDMGWMNSPILRLTLSENVLCLSQDCTVRCVSGCPSLCTVRVHRLLVIVVVVNSCWEVWALPLFKFMR